MSQERAEPGNVGWATGRYMLATRDWHKARATSSTPKSRKWKSAFIEALREHGVVSYSANIAGIDRSTAYKLRKTDPEFAQAWDDALEEGIEELERAAIKRAKAKSDTLLIFLLKCRKPGIYGDKQRIELAGGDKPIRLRVEYSDDFTAPPPSRASGGYRQGRNIQRAGKRKAMGKDSSGA